MVLYLFLQNIFYKHAYFSSELRHPVTFQMHQTSHIVPLTRRCCCCPAASTVTSEGNLTRCFLQIWLNSYLHSVIFAAQIPNPICIRLLERICHFEQVSSDINNMKCDIYIYYTSTYCCIAAKLLNFLLVRELNQHMDVTSKPRRRAFPPVSASERSHSQRLWSHVQRRPVEPQGWDKNKPLSCGRHARRCVPGPGVLPERRRSHSSQSAELEQRLYF